MKQFLAKLALYRIKGKKNCKSHQFPTYSYKATGVEYKQKIEVSISLCYFTKNKVFSRLPHKLMQYL